MKTLTLLIAFTILILQVHHAQKSPCGNLHKKAQPRVYLNCLDQIMYDEEINTYVLAKDGDTPFNGTCQSYNRSGFVLEELSFKNGKRDGVDTSYFSSGCVQSTQGYIIGIKNGAHKVFYDTTGQLRKEENYQDGKYHGRVCEFNYYGDTLLYMNYNQGIPDGEQREYYQDGKIASVSNYKKGLINGIHFKYSMNGKLESKLSYKDGKHNGKWTYYSESGKEIGIQNWLMGQKNGEFSKTSEQGVVLSKGEFKKDVPVGEHIENDEKGKLIHQTIYDKKGVKQYEMMMDEYGEKKVLFDINKTEIKDANGIQSNDDNPENITKKDEKVQKRKRKKERKTKEKE